MHSEHQTLSAFRQHYPERELAQMLGRLLRVPEAWRALHNPAFMEEVRSSAPPAHLTPSHLAALALGGELESRISSELARPHQQRAEQLWQQTLAGGFGGWDLFETALVGLALSQQIAAERSLIDQVAANPGVWRSPLCLAWPALENPEAVLAKLMAAGAHQLAMQIALSNLPVEQAASYLARNAEGSAVALLLSSFRAGERQLTRTLAAPAGSNGFSHLDGLAPLLFQAVAEHERGQPEAARRMLGRAWDSATQVMAQVADLMGDMARAEGDAVTELEAHRRALDAAPSAARRARTAQTLSNMERTAEALALLAGPDLSVEEQIVLGGIQADQRQFEQAADSLNAAAAKLEASQEVLDHGWYLQLTSGLRKCREIEAAIRVGGTHLLAYPANAAARGNLAALLAEAGDWERCAVEADLAVGLEPDSVANRELLAQAFQQIGDHSAALQQLRQLPEPDSQALAQAAIKAGELDLAGSVVEQMLTQDPASVAAHISLGRILAEKGEPASANAAYLEALRLAPQRAEPHLALAAWQQASGETEAAGKTLMQAAQIAPGDAAVQIALAEWMADGGRESEAAEAAAKAVELDPDNLEFLLVHSKLLAKLGHLDQALADLTVACRRAPRNWKIGLGTAEVLEQQGNARQAAQQLPELPASAGARDWLAVGRIGVQAGLDLQSAITALETAEQHGCDSASLHYWYARGLEGLEQFDAARDRYAKSLERIGDGGGELREQATLGLARCELQRGRISAALEVLEHARQSFGGGPRILALSAQVYRSAKLPDKAVEVARAAVEADESDPAGWEALSEALAGAGDFAGAFSAADQQLALRPGAIGSWLQIARLASEAGERAVQRRALARAVWHARQDPDSLARVATSMVELGLPESAIRTLGAALRKRPDDRALLGSMAELLESCGELDRAQQAWLACAELAPDDEAPLRKAAACADRLGSSHKSIELLERAQKLNPNSPGLGRQLASAYVANGQVSRGIQAYSSALREAPNDLSLAMEAAQAALQAEAGREALGFIGRAQQLAADEGQVQAALGEGYLLLNEPEQAAAALERALELGRSSARVLAMLSIVRSDSPDARQAAQGARARSAHEAVWLARAHALFLEFNQAIELLSSWRSEPAAALELARTMLRARDAAWLRSYADLGRAGGGQQHEARLEEVLSELDHQPVDPAKLAPLHRWRLAEHDPQALRQHVGDDQTGQLGEALVIAHLSSGVLDHAAEAIELAKDANPNAPWLNVLEGACRELTGQPEQARAYYRRATDAGPLRPVAEYLIGRSYAAARSLDRAVSHMGRAAALWMHEPAWQYQLGQLYLAQGDPDSALGHFQSAAGADPDVLDYQLALAKTYRDSGHLHQAQAAFTAALRGSEATGEHYRMAGEVALQIDRPDEAAQRFERACSLSPEDPLAYLGAANAAAALGDRQAAEKHLRAAIRLDPNRLEVLVGQGQVLMQTGKPAAAMEAFDRALEAGADPAQVHRSRSKLLMRQGDAEAALGSLRQALEADPEDDGAWHELALALETHSELAAADEAIGQALRLAPRNPEYRLALARISRQSGNLDRAIEELRQARKVVPEDPRLAVEVGMVHEQRREYSRALDAYREAIEIDAACLEAYYRAGLLLRTLKAYRRAGEMLKHASELAPVNKEILHQLAAVRALELVHG